MKEFFEVPDLSIDRNGDAEFDQQQGSASAGVYIKRADRPRFALELLGGITDEMIERGAKAVYDSFDGLRDRGHYTDDGAMAEAKTVARAVLLAVFGESEPRTEGE